MTGLSPYLPRRFVSDGVWSIDGLKLKSYLITRRDAPSIDATMIDNAKSYIELTIPAIRRQEGADHGLGYVIVHAGEMGNWLLIHWWAYEDIALRMLASAEVGDHRFKSEDHRRFHACVWEHVAIDHERNAWVQEMMRRDGSAERYLSNRLSDGEY